MGLVVTDIRKLLVAVRYDRRALVRPHRGHDLNHIRNQIGVCDHHLLRLVAAKIGKLVKHFLRRAQIQGRLVVRVRETLPRHDDAAVNFIFRV